MEKFKFRPRPAEAGLFAKPKRPATTADIEEREKQRKIRDIYKDHAKSQAGPGGIPQKTKRRINRMTRIRKGPSDDADNDGFDE